jgi:hypothetical protein
MSRLPFLMGFLIGRLDDENRPMRSSNMGYPHEGRIGPEKRRARLRRYREVESTACVQEMFPLFFNYGTKLEEWTCASFPF